jgi:2-polyprenyl-3-methyl-5-hydroxy-6-metoxy-1,4-benzoquinol methylase
LKQSIAFLRGPDGLDYGRRLSRLRWIRAVPGSSVVAISAAAPAGVELAGSDAWLIVRDETALPLPLPRFPLPGAGRVLVASRVVPEETPAHTLRELEAFAPVGTNEPVRPDFVLAFSFHASDFPTRPGESADEFFDRVLGDGVEKEASAEFRVFAFGDPSELEREEITRHVPAGVGRLLDVGCGAGGSSAGLKRRRGGLHVTALEKDRRLAGRACERLDRVLEGDAVESLTALARDRESFDAFLFADVLEHLENPARALSVARSLAAPGAVLVASVPNAGHLSLVRDLVLGRFDPVPAGLSDAGHLRWFTRASLEEMLRETGWKVATIESCPGVPAPEAGEFLASLARWRDLDAESLATYQWIAVATADH